jgi:hypothetical protein
MDDGEQRLKQEDCSEDSLGSGILTLTSKRIAFDKTRARMMDFSKHMGDTILDIPLQNIKEIWKEGLFMKKVCFKVNNEGDEKIYKFGVFNTKSWLKSIEEAKK